MKPFRAMNVATLAVLGSLAAGCSAGGDIADRPQNSPPAVDDDVVDLDGVRFDVRPDPG